MKTSLRLPTLLGVVALTAAACGSAPDETGGGATASGATDFQACMVTDEGGIDDRSFNANSWKGLEDAKANLGIQAKYLESNATADYAPNLSQLISDDCGIIVTVGFNLGDTTKAAAEANPEERFAIVDNSYDPPIANIKPLVFDTAQAAFLAGYAAAGMTTTGTVATFGGLQIPSVTIFMDGFVDGVAKHNTDKGTSVKVLGWDKAAQNGTFNGNFTDQNTGKQITQNFVQQGADIILPVAGPVGLGTTAAALESGGKVSVIWVDTDGYESLPAANKPVILTSVLKKLDAATEVAAKDALEDTFTNEPYVGTLKNEGVGLAPFHDFDAKVPAELKSELEKLQADIASGAVTVESPSSPKA